MKKNVMIVMLYLIMIGITCCCTNRAPENKVVTDAIASLRSSLPIHMEGIGMVRDIEYEQNTVLFRMRIKEDSSYGVSVTKISENNTLAKEIIAAQIGMMGDQTKRDIKSIAGQSYGLRVIISGSSSTRDGEVFLSPEELESALANAQHKSVDDFSLEMVAMTTRLMLPVRIDQVTTWIDTRLTDSSFEYIHRLNDEGMNLSNLDMGIMKSEQISRLSQNMDVMGNVVRCCISTHRNLVYKYIGNSSNKEINVILTESDLRNNL